MPERQFAVHWHQANPDSVSLWEFQFSRIGTDWHWVTQAHPVDGCDDCFEATVTVPDDALFVRSRAVGIDGGVSDWTPRFALPESDTTALLFFGVIWLALIAWMTNRMG